MIGLAGSTQKSSFLPEAFRAFSGSRTGIKAWVVDGWLGSSVEAVLPKLVPSILIASSKATGPSAIFWGRLPACWRRSPRHTPCVMATQSSV